MIRNLTPDDLQHLRYVIALLKSEGRYTLAEMLLDFTENRLTDSALILELRKMLDNEADSTTYMDYRED